MIQATVTGNIGRKPELRDTKSGKKMASFSVASSTRRDDREPETTWIDVVCFDELAEGVAGNTDKGMRVVLTGELALEKYQKSDGTEAQSLRMIAREVALTVRAKRAEKEQPARRQQRRDEPW